MLATRQYIFELLARSGPALGGLWAIGTGIALMIVVTAFLFSEGEL